MKTLESVYLEGKQAKEAGLDRISFYSNIEHNHYWYAGYDGVEVEKDRSINANLSYSRIGLNNV